MTLVSLILIPFLGGLIAWQSERSGAQAPRLIALATMVVGLVLSLWLWATHDYSLTGAGFAFGGGGAPAWSLEYRADWIPAIGATFHLGLDGLSLLLIVLTNLLGVLAVLSSWREIDRKVGLFHFSLLVNIAGVTGVFLALDLLLFFFFWEMMLVPMYFLIVLWGHEGPGQPGRVASAVKFFLFTQASGLILLVAILALVYVHYSTTGVASFDYHDLLDTPMSPRLEWWLMLGFFFAFAIKLPIVPLHAWLPDAHCSAPTGGSVDLAGLLLKTAAYGLMRFAIPFFPHASAEFAQVAMWLGVVGIVYGAVVAFAQHDLKRLVAYTGISHLGFVVVGIYAGGEQALLGVVVQMIAHGLSAGALFIICGAVFERFGTRDMRELGGLWARLPKLSPLLLFFALASLGLPGLGNFVGEFLILSGTFAVAPVVAIAAASGLVLAVTYSLLLVQRVVYGPLAGAAVDSPGVPRAGARAVADLTARELGMLLSLAVLLLGLGLYPQPVIDASRAPVQAMEALYHGATIESPGAQP